MLFCREMPMRAVANALRERDIRLWRVAAHHVEAAYAKNSWAQVRTISVDETSARRAHRYVTNVLDAETHELLLMVEGRSAKALEAFAQALVAHGGKAQQIELISMDMSPAYQSGASRFFPQAQIVFDRFHLMPVTLGDPPKIVSCGNVWCEETMRALMASTKNADIAIDWYGNLGNDVAREELAASGIRLRGSVAHEDLIAALRKYDLAVVAVPDESFFDRT